MATAETIDLKSYCRELATAARAAAAELALAKGDVKNRWLRRAADALREQTQVLLEANQRDIDRAGEFGLTRAQVDRLRLTPGRISEMAAGLLDVAALPDPVGEVVWSSVRPNGLEVLKVRVPLGVIFFIYESRPNVTADAAALCVKSGNAVILRGGKEAIHSNRAIHGVLRDALVEVGLPAGAVSLVGTTDRAAVGHFLKMAGTIDLVIPRGGKELIHRVAEEAEMPVLKHFEGNCHVYVDRAADLEMALAVLINAKCQRPGVCNAAESLLVHRDVAAAFLPVAASRLLAAGVELRGCAETRRLVPQAKPATDADYAAEFLDLILSVRVVDSLDEAIAHVNRYGSQHTDAIITNDLAAAREFTARVDSAAVMVNASTRFHDGGQFGLGAEIGISTDKFHARGPCGLVELTSTKYVVWGDGQVRGCSENDEPDSEKLVVMPRRGTLKP